MKLDFSCTQDRIRGRLQITDDEFLQFVSRKSPGWRVPCSAIQNFGAQPSPLGLLTVIIYTAKNQQTIGPMAKIFFKQLMTYFPSIPVTPGPRVWYFDPVALTHIETYTDQQLMQRDVEGAYRDGWVLQGQSGGSGQGNIGAMVAGALIAGVPGAIVGGLAGSNITTLTFVRSPEWLNQHKQRS